MSLQLIITIRYANSFAFNPICRGPQAMGTEDFVGFCGLIAVSTVDEFLAGFLLIGAVEVLVEAQELGVEAHGWFP